MHRTMTAAYSVHLLSIVILFLAACSRSAQMPGELGSDEELLYSFGRCLGNTPDAVISLKPTPDAEESGFAERAIGIGRVARFPSSLWKRSRTETI